MKSINVTAKDGASIPAFFSDFDASAIKGVVIVSYGFGEYTGLYMEVADKFKQAGYAVILFEQRGHGAPPDGCKKWFGVIPGYQCFLDDIESVTVAARQMAPDAPIILYGHSMGGNIVVNTLLRRQDPVYTCAVLESPWLGLYKGPGKLLTAIVRFLSRIIPNFIIVNKLEVKDLSGDQSRAERYAPDPLYHNHISFRMYTGIDAACFNAMANAALLPAPTFLAYATNDRIISNQAIFEFAADAGIMVTIKEYDCCHAIHNDVKREDFFRDMIAFLDTHCVPAPAAEPDA